MNDDFPAVMGFLADEFPINELTELDSNTLVDLAPMTRRITRAYHGIVKPNPRYP